MQVLQLISKKSVGIRGRDGNVEIGLSSFAGNYSLRPW